MTNEQEPISQADGYAGEERKISGGEWFRFLNPGVPDEYEPEE